MAGSWLDLLRSCWSSRSLLDLSGFVLGELAVEPVALEVGRGFGYIM